MRVELERHQPERGERRGSRIGMSFVVRMVGPATFEPALEPMYGMPASTCAESIQRSHSYSAFSSRRCCRADEDRRRAVDGRARSGLVDRVETDAHGLEALARERRVLGVIAQRERHEEHPPGAVQDVGDRALGVVEITAAVERRVADQSTASRSRA